MSTTLVELYIARELVPLALSSVRLAVVAGVGSTFFPLPIEAAGIPTRASAPFLHLQHLSTGQTRAWGAPSAPSTREQVHPGRRCLLKSATRLPLEDHMTLRACSEPGKLEVELVTLSSATLSEPHPLLKALMVLRKHLSTFLLAVAEAES